MRRNAFARSTWPGARTWSAERCGSSGGAPSRSADKWTPSEPHLQNQNDADFIKRFIRTVPDWPQPGIQFRDITPVLQDRKAFRVLVDLFVHRYMDAGLDLVAGIDARGFILGAVVAYELNLGFVPIRKQGKLPHATLAESYALEYGTGTVEIHADACREGDRALLIDDLIATGGTMLAGIRLLERLGASVAACAAIVDLPQLGGSARLADAGFPPFACASSPDTDDPAIALAAGRARPRGFRCRRRRNCAGAGSTGPRTGIRLARQAIGAVDASDGGGRQSARRRSWIADAGARRQRGRRGDRNPARAQPGRAAIFGNRRRWFHASLCRARAAARTL